jgi:hypothetical protein
MGLRMTDTASAPVTEQSWITKVGRRNLAYVIFVAILVLVANLLEAGGPVGPDAGGGMMMGFIAWGLVSLVFFAVNLILLIRALVKSLPVRKPLVACLLPVLLIVGTLLAEDIMLR